MKIRRTLAILSCGVATYACSVVDPKPPAENGGIKSFSLSADSVDADEAHIDTLVAVIDTAYRVTNSTVTFTTTAGSFSNGNSSLATQPDSNGVARAFLKAPKDPIVAVVTASVGAKLQTRRLTFRPALPQFTNVTVDSLIMHANVSSRNTIRADLERTLGTVSPGGTIGFTVDTITGTPSLALSVTRVPSTATAQSTLTVIGTDTGSVDVSAWFSRDNDTTIVAKATVRLHIIP